MTHAESMIGNTNAKRKLTPENVRLARSSVGRITAQELAGRWGVSKICVEKVRDYSTWRGVL